MRRREFITLLGSAAATWPLAARAQQATMPVIGFLGSATEADYRSTIATFREGLKQSWLCGGTKSPDRLSLGKFSIRAAARARSRTGQSPG